MSDVVIWLTLALSLLIIFLLGLVLYQARKRSLSKGSADGSDDVVAARPRRLAAPRNDEAPRNARGRRNRINISPREENEDIGRNVGGFSGEYGDEEEDELGDMIDLPEGGKIGAKKRKKLEMKAEKRNARERELEERQEKKERQAKLDEQRRKEEEKAKAEEKAREEEERRLKEEKERIEHEEYLKMKEMFAVEEEGFDEDVDESEANNKLQAFIDYIKQQKVVLLEDLAGHFGMKTQDVIARVQDLLQQEMLVGVIDDRGKFIYITREELEQVAKFIKQRGRVSISELVESSNSLITLTPEESLVKS